MRRKGGLADTNSKSIDEKILSITKAITEPFVIVPKDKAAFGLAFNAKSDAQQINDFSLQAYSDNYLSNTFISSK